MYARQLAAAGLGTALLLQGCASTPLGPTVSVLPSPGKPFETFQADVAVCKDFAASQVAGQANRANGLGVGTAVLGTVLGAGLGAAIGGGNGAAIGAGAGALGGSGIGASTSGNAQFSIQQQYDNAYVQCQYAKGNQIAQSPAVFVGAPPPPPGYYAPPPPGY